METKIQERTRRIASLAAKKKREKPTLRAPRETLSLWLRARERNCRSKELPCTDRSFFGSGFYRLSSFFFFFFWVRLLGAYLPSEYISFFCARLALFASLSLSLYRSMMISGRARRSTAIETRMYLEYRAKTVENMMGGTLLFRNHRPRTLCRYGK